MPAERPHASVPLAADYLLADLRAVVRDAEALLKATEGLAGERIAEVRARVQESMNGARARLEGAGARVEERARTAARSTDTYVRENPWIAMAIAAGIGYVLGSLGRRR